MSAMQVAGFVVYLVVGLVLASVYVYCEGRRVYGTRPGGELLFIVTAWPAVGLLMLLGRLFDAVYDCAAKHQQIRQASAKLPTEGEIVNRCARTRCQRFCMARVPVDGLDGKPHD